MGLLGHDHCFEEDYVRVVLPFSEGELEVIGVLQRHDFPLLLPCWILVQLWATSIYENTPLFFPKENGSSSFSTTH